MQVILCYNLAALAIAVIYYAWRDYYLRPRQEKERILRERVAYMLWVAANHVA
jgi:hypothetical protein